MNDLITINNGVALLDAEISRKIADFEFKIKEIKKAEEKMKQNILEEMAEKGIIKVETDDIIINYISPTDKETFDIKTFRKDYADLYDEYVKLSPVKASVRIRTKK